MKHLWKNFAKMMMFFSYICSQEHVKELVESKEMTLYLSASHVVYRRLKTTLRTSVWERKFLEVLVNCFTVIRNDGKTAPLKSIEKISEKMKEANEGLASYLGELDNEGILFKSA